MTMPLLVAFCLTLMLLSALQRDWLLHRSREAREALRDLRRAMPLGDYTLMVERGLLQLEQACAAAGAVESGDDELLLQTIREQAGTLLPVMRARLRTCADVAALLAAAPPVAPLHARDLHLPSLRGAAHTDTWGRHVLSPLRHLRLHLTLLHWGLGRVQRALLCPRLPLERAARRRIAAGGADAGTLGRVSVDACAALLRSPVLLRYQPPPAADSGQTYVM